MNHAVCIGKAWQCCDTALTGLQHVIWSAFCSIISRRDPAHKHLSSGHCIKKLPHVFALYRPNGNFSSSVADVPWLQSMVLDRANLPGWQGAGSGTGRGISLYPSRPQIAHAAVTEKRAFFTRAEWKTNRRCHGDGAGEALKGKMCRIDRRVHKNEEKG